VVIADVNAALIGLLTPLLPAGCGVRFGAPDSVPDDPAVVFFLAEIHEDERAGDPDWEDLRDSDGKVVARRPPVRRFELHYLVSVPTPDPVLEAAGLDAVLTAVDPGKRLPAELFGDRLAGRPVMLRLGAQVPYPLDRTTLRVIASAPLVLPPMTDLPAPAENISLGVASPESPITPPRVPTPGRRWGNASIDEGN
jgi:hypothetical protein